MWGSGSVSKHQFLDPPEYVYRDPAGIRVVQWASVDPASKTSTLFAGFSDNRSAKNPPADPDPTMM